MEPNQVVPIDEEARYAVIFRNQVLDMNELARISQRLSDWWESGEKFLLIDGNVEFVRIVEAKELDDAISEIDL